MPQTLSAPVRPQRPPKSGLCNLARGAGKCVLQGFSATIHHLRKHVGVGIICAVAYFDPGNWSVDLQAGSSFGYRPMLFVILMAGLGAIVLQTLATRLGCVTGLDLASHCRLLLHNRTRRPRLVRWLVLYPLYVLSEIAIISTDLAELLGSAIGFCLIFPKLPLYAGVLLTAADVLVFLAISDPYKGQGRPVKTFELIIVGLVLTVFACFVALLVRAKPNWGDVFMGYIPDKNLVRSQPDAVYAAVGILGATVMPHALFLGSSLATQDRVSVAPITMDAVGSPAEGGFSVWIRRCFRSVFNISRAERADAGRNHRGPHEERENNSLTFIRQHLTHGVVDVVTSLLFLAVPINSAILIIAATVFYTGPEQENKISAGLFDAHDLIKSRIGSGAALVFALALVCAGQTSSITVTLAGQLVSEGFIEWRMPPFLRRLITRLISLVPSVVVAIAVGRAGIDTLLVASQVVLSIVLPFVAFPLIYLTSTEKVMRVRKPDTVPPREASNGTEDGPPSPVTHDRHPESVATRVFPLEDTEKINETHVRTADAFLDFRSHKVVTCLAYAIWCVVVVANAYAIVMLVVDDGEVNPDFDW
ncbi:Nramp-domain-containing protein [Macrolepiota fuliginosa MF-IS2]|uniref:Nramp-domain-containing protein n=1 Tax=Macrolepiota fuliginosa MF-IS2 TaxID=1400762 RepID=A0A9P6C5K0_9AGAR|nr:Nramp-domain-containing protein [Macrolepiota fuliginosa MF-IS2]